MEIELPINMSINSLRTQSYICKISIGKEVLFPTLNQFLWEINFFLDSLPISSSENLDGQ